MGGDGIRIAVLGPIPRDRITFPSGMTSDRYGGALYTAVALASLAGRGATIHLVSHVRAEDAPALRGILDRYPNIDRSLLSSEADRGAVIHLTYLDENRRMERQTGFMCPILPEHVESLMDCDALILVPITDFEVPLETLRHIRANSDALIVFDAHGQTTGCSRDGTRYPKFWIDRDRWLPHIDLLKMNIDEARSCWFEGEGPADGLEADDRLAMEALPLLARHCLDHGVKGLYVTLDRQGCTVYCRDAGGVLEEHRVSPVPVEEVVDTTGCGDSFAAGMALGYLATGSHREAARLGNYAGAMRSSSLELDVYGTFDDALARIAAEYGR